MAKGENIYSENASANNFLDRKILALPEDLQVLFTPGVKDAILVIFRKIASFPDMGSEIESSLSGHENKGASERGGKSVRICNDEVFTILTLGSGDFDVPNSHLYFNTEILEQIIKLFAERGTTILKKQQVNIVNSKDEVKNITVLHASSGEGHNMTDVRLRDQSFAVLSELRRRMLDRNEYAEDGNSAKEMILGLCDLVSRESDIGRMVTMIAKAGDPDYINNPHNHLHIKWSIKENQIDEIQNRKHNQDARQQFVMVLCLAIREGLITHNNLSEDIINWLKGITEYAKVVDPTRVEMSGSWEESSAIKQSVIVCQLAAMQGLQSIQDLPGFEFLQAGMSDRSTMIANYSNMINRMGTNESPDYEQNNPKYRREDSALLYRPFLEVAGDWDVSDIDLVKAVLEGLFDPKTGGINRYKGDSYQALGMYYPRVRDALVNPNYGLWTQSDFKDTAGVLHYAVRGWMNEYAGNVLNMETAGKEPGWTHFHFQIASRASGAYIKHAKEEKPNEELLTELYDIAVLELLRGIGMITGDNEKTLSPIDGTDEDGRAQTAVKDADPLCIPEVRMYVGNMVGKDIIVPGPWNPLFRGVATCKEALAMVKKMFEVVDGRSTK